MNFHQSSPSRDALDWRAFCYVTDELSAEERADFERRLLDEQEAREAVARAVEVLHAAQVVLAETTVQATPRSTARRFLRGFSRLGWMSLGVAACLLLALGLQQAGWLVVPGANQRGEVAEQDAPNHFDAADEELGSALALAWTQTRKLLSPPDAGAVGWEETGARERTNLFSPSKWAEATDAASSRFLAEDVSSHEVLAIENTTEEAPFEDAVVATPTWMLAAVAGMEQSGQPSAEAENPDGPKPELSVPQTDNQEG